MPLRSIRRPADHHPPRTQKKRGFAAECAALAMRVLALIVFIGAFDAGRVLFISRNAAAAAREAARELGATSVGDCANPTAQRLRTQAEGSTGPALRYLAHVGLADASTVTTICRMQTMAPSWSVHVRIDYRSVFLNLFDSGAGTTDARRTDSLQAMMSTASK